MSESPRYVVMYATAATLEDACCELAAKVHSMTSGGHWQPLGSVSICSTVQDVEPDWDSEPYRMALNSGLAIRPKPTWFVHAAQAMARASDGE